MKVASCKKVEIFLIFFLMLLGANMIFAQQDVRVSLVSRLEFDPVLLDAIRENIIEKLQMPCSLALHSRDDLLGSRVDKGFSHLLIEDGIDTDSIQSEFYHDTEILTLVWVMAVRGDAIELLGDREDLSLKEFFEMLSVLKKKRANKYPWFEALHSRVTMRNFCLLWDSESQDSETGKTLIRPAWHEANAVGILYRAIESELLNPLSVESDTTLSGSVFAAGDSCFSTTWVPIEQFINQKKSAPEIYLPLPDLTGQQRVFSISLSLWQRKPMIVNTVVSNSYDLQNLTWKLISLDYLQDQLWLTEKFDKVYDALIMGDY